MKCTGTCTCILISWLVYFRSKLKDIKELQRQREKPNGISAAMLALGKKIPKTEEVTDVGFKEFIFIPTTLSVVVLKKCMSDVIPS